MHERAAMLPSPTADATRFTGPKRTSLHAKMPGRSSRGVRVAAELPAARGRHVGAAPMTMKSPAGLEPARLSGARSRIARGQCAARHVRHSIAHNSTGSAMPFSSTARPDDVGNRTVVPASVLALARISPPSAIAEIRAAS
jgi:hypothetical protein